MEALKKGSAHKGGALGEHDDAAGAVAGQEMEDLKVQVSSLQFQLKELQGAAADTPRDEAPPSPLSETGFKLKKLAPPPTPLDSMPGAARRTPSTDGGKGSRRNVLEPPPDASAIFSGESSGRRSTTSSRRASPERASVVPPSPTNSDGRGLLRLTAERDEARAALAKAGQELAALNAEVAQLRESSERSSMRAVHAELERVSYEVASEAITGALGEYRLGFPTVVAAAPAGGSAAVSSAPSGKLAALERENAQLKAQLDKASVPPPMSPSAVAPAVSAVDDASLSRASEEVVLKATVAALGDEIAALQQQNALLKAELEAALVLPPTSSSAAAPAAPSVAAAAAAASDATEVAELKGRVKTLGDEIAALQQQNALLKAELDAALVLPPTSSSAAAPAAAAPSVAAAAAAASDAAEVAELRGRVKTLERELAASCADGDDSARLARQAKDELEAKVTALEHQISLMTNIAEDARSGKELTTQQLNVRLAEALAQTSAEQAKARRLQEDLENVTQALEKAKVNLTELKKEKVELLDKVEEAQQFRRTVSVKQEQDAADAKTSQLMLEVERNGLKGARSPYVLVLIVGDFVEVGSRACMLVRRVGVATVVTACCRGLVCADEMQALKVQIAEIKGREQALQDELARKAADLAALKDSYASDKLESQKSALEVSPPPPPPLLLLLLLLLSTSTRTHYYCFDYC